MSPHTETNTASRAAAPRTTISWWFSKLIAPALTLLAGLLVIVALGVAQRAGWISAGTTEGVAANSVEIIYTCPMHPNIRQPTPGDCPTCGMPLVPATSGGDADLDELSVRIGVAQRRLSNIETVKVLRAPIVETIQTIGAIAVDESRMATIASYIDGRLEKLFADYTGVAVAKNDHLAMIYSPQMYAAQVEYLQSRKAIEASSKSLAVVRRAQEDLVANSRQKLVELGMREDQIRSLEETRRAISRLTIYAPVGGTVMEKLAVEGKYIKAGEPIYRIADLSTVWLMLELYPIDASRIRFGQRVEAEMTSLPGEVFYGRIAFIDRTVNQKKRTVGVRVEFLNHDGRLRPGDYASASIFIPVGQSGQVFDADLAGKWISPMHPQIISDQPGQCPVCGMDLVPTSQYGYSKTPVKRPSSLYVPRSALLMAGKNSVVYVEEEPGRFEIRPVVLGPILRERVIVLSGIQEGELVATAGNFLIDSQMQLAGKPSLIDPTRAVIAHRERKTPLKFPNVDVLGVSDEVGAMLEDLYAAYFRIQRTLASDQRPQEADATRLHELASELEADSELPEQTRQLFAEIAKQSEHLHHLPLNEARHKSFRPISHAVVTLATTVRGDSAKANFRHMFCPMVKGGAGDWLQPDDKLRNPYWGSKMLECGRIVHTFPLTGAMTSSIEEDGAKGSR